jgi:hypothetical protein
MIYDKYRGKNTGPQCVNKDNPITGHPPNLERLITATSQARI